MDQDLVPGTFIKTIGSRDRVGLRRIVSVYRSGLMVDHYNWKMVRTELGDGKTKKEFFAVRSPYSSVVSIKKVIRIYTIDQDLKYITERKVKYES